MLNILQKSVEIINTQFFPHVTLKHIHQFRFGIQAFTFSPFSSLNSNARLVVENRQTASSKMYRLTRNTGMRKNFFSILKACNFVNDKSVVIIDFSTFCEFQVLTLALQTREGRAIPLFFDIITYPITEATSQNIFIQETLKKFHDILGFYPSFVLDRGFAIPSLMTFFIDNQITFYVRAKKGKHVVVLNEAGDEQRLPIADIKVYDQQIKAYEYQLRLITSDKPKDKKEPWYILTNDTNRKRKEIIEIYYYRFEIEEVFKDIKHLFKLKQFFITEKQPFQIVLWFIIAGTWLAYLIDEIRLRRQEHEHKKLSFIRLWFEGLHRSFYLQIFNSTHSSHFY
jgi:DDE family transposase